MGGISGEPRRRRSAGFLTCRIAEFLFRQAFVKPDAFELPHSLADWKVCDTADSKVCVTPRVAQAFLPAVSRNFYSARRSSQRTRSNCRTAADWKVCVTEGRRSGGFLTRFHLQSNCA